MWILISDSQNIDYRTNQIYSFVLRLISSIGVEVPEN